MIAQLLLALLFCIAPTTGTDHTCIGNKTEPAGLSGTVHVDKGCDLILTNITGNISIFGVRRSTCEGDQKLVINGEMYCIDENATAEIITVAGNALEVEAEQVNNFTMEYYHGKSCD